MTFRDLKSILDTATDKQLDWPVVVFIGDEDHGRKVSSIDKTGMDTYWYDGDFVGEKIDAEKVVADNPDIFIDDFVVIPKGTLTLQVQHDPNLF